MYMYMYIYEWPKCCPPFHLQIILSYLMISPSFPVVLCPLVFKKMNTYIKHLLAYYLLGKHQDFIIN